MAAEGIVRLTGESGTRYEFETYPWGTRLNPLGGVYLVLRKQLLTGQYDVLYIGQTGDLSERFDNHHQAACFDKNRRTHIAVRLEQSENRRLAMETDLIRVNSTSCNQQ